MINSIVAALINIMLNLFFIPFFGFIGAAYTTLFTNIVQTVLHYVNYKRIVQKDIYNMRILALISIGIIIICLSIQILYAYTVVRYILFSFLCLIIIKKGAPLFSKILMI
jgi:O-antigen/teichoic acid export membrane protein